MKISTLVFAAVTCLIAAPAFAGSSAIANSPMRLAQVDVHIGDRDHDRDRDRRLAMDRDHDRGHCRMNTIRENHDGRIVIRREKHCD
jgi:Ni/Co efflux regulator RcnB